MGDVGVAADDAGSGRSRSVVRRAALLAALCLALGATEASAVTINEFAAPGAPFGIAPGPDGNLWYTQFDDAQVGRLTSAGALLAGDINVSDDPNNSGPEAIVPGPRDGTLWFADAFANRVGRLNATGLLGESPLGGGSEPQDLVAGPDGNMWVTETGDDEVARVSANGATVSERATGDGPTGITVGPDGALWFTLAGDDRIGRITTALVLEGGVTLPPLPGDDARGLGDITTGPDGNLWFVEEQANKIGRVTPAGVLTEFTIPTPNSRAGDIVSAPDGNLWFTEQAGKVARITPSGTITEFVVPTPAGEPSAMTVGPDGRLWFTESAEGANKVGRVTLDLPTVTTGAARALTQTSASLTGSVDPNAARTTYYFQYGTTTAYGSRTPGAPAGAGDSPVGVTAALSGLRPGTTYFYRLVASSSIGTRLGAGRTLRTATASTPGGGPPTVASSSVARTGARGVRLRAAIDPNGFVTSYFAECGRTTRYGRRSRSGRIEPAAGTSSVSISIGGLRPATRYRCRVVAESSGGTAAGDDLQFRTDSGLALSVARLVVAQEGKPFSVRFRTSAAASVTVSLLRLGGGGDARATRVLRRVRARRGRNGVRLPGLRAGRFRLTLTARTSAGDRATDRARLLVAPAPAPRFTG